ncbi:MAG: CheR family methyltransferase [Planctomycetota bacterium]
MKPENYDYLAELLLERIGFVLGENKQHLLNARLASIAERHGAADLDALVDTLRQNDAVPLLAEVVDAMTTSETSFFRDGKPLETLFRQVLPRLMERRRGERRLRIWNAACSSGQETYSIVMGILDRLPELANWRLEIVGTDISGRTLEQARAGIYNRFEVQRGLPNTSLVKYFESVGNHFRLQPVVTSRVRVEELNLLEPFTWLGSFDVIFCRDVLIYFAPTAKGEILSRLSRALKPDGYLFLGGTETTRGVTDALQRVKVGDSEVYCHSAASHDIVHFGAPQVA